MADDIPQYEFSADEEYQAAARKGVANMKAAQERKAAQNARQAAATRLANGVLRGTIREPSE
jgi:hypothetical protein